MELVHTYFGLRLPNIKIAVTGSGRVAHGILEIMNLLDVQQVEPEDYIKRKYAYPVYLHLKGGELYTHKETGNYDRTLFHEHPEQFNCLFNKYLKQTNILMNGVYWEKGIPPLFTMDDLKDDDFALTTIADITDDENGSIPINLGDATSDAPVYGVDINTCTKTAPYFHSSIDVMAVGNLPNELPRDASRFFGEQLIKYVLPDLIGQGNDIIRKATILDNGIITEHYSYLNDYANQEMPFYKCK
jgi:hypothetical protein